MPFDMTSEVQGNTARLVLIGELDGSSAPRVREEVDKALKSTPARLVLVMDQLNFMASAGLRILIFAKQRQPDLKIYLIRPQDSVVDTLKKTGFYDGVYVQDSDVLDEAAAG
jgi:anti-anti-sigma factor